MCLRVPVSHTDIPFDNVWLASKILGEGLVGVRLAPREPLVRDAIVCSVCGLHVGSPAEDPAYWVNQFGAAVQCAVGAPAFTCYDCILHAIAHGVGMVSVVPGMSN